MELAIAEVWSAVLGLSGLGVEDNFFELGGNSLLAQKTISCIKEKLQYDIPVTRLYQHPTIAGLQQYLQGGKKQHKSYAKRKTATNENSDIAVIGLECNFPQAETVMAFWELLKSGKEAITFFTNDEIDPSIPTELKNDVNYIKARGILPDAAFFGINPRQAEVMDPQHRLFLMAAHNLLEKTGYLPEKNNTITGVFAGCSTNLYFSNNVVWRRDIMEQQGRFGIVSASDKDYISTRAAYQLNLEGPAINVNSACSTSLLAVAEAVKSLRAGECDVAIAGGAAVQAPIHNGHIYQEGAIYSSDGHTRTFDANAKGTVFSDGVGAVLLKPVENAKRDGDIIYAVIKGIGVNNDGGNKGSFSAPSAEGQSGAIVMAINDAGISPSEITYIEAHGTATPLGDPIEIEGLKIAFGNQEKNQYCRIGSVKSNMGHMIHAAGVAGLMKTALALHHKKIPPTINFNNPNPVIDFENSPFIINDKLINWEYETKRIAGVSSFGVGGTNVHVVMEEYVDDRPQTIEPSTTPQLITWSARNAESLNAYAQKLAVFIEAQLTINIADVAYTLQKTRQEFAARNAIVAVDAKDLVKQLKEHEKLAAQTAHLNEKGLGVVFMFPGQGSQYVNMGKELYQQEPVYKKAVDACANILLAETGEDIRQIIFTNNDEAASAEKLKNTYYTQPAIFVVSYALAKLYMSWGIKPQAMLGHSVGEFVAAHLAGVFSLEDVLKIVAMRAKLISELPAGAMLSVRASAENIQTFLPPAISLAANNAPNLCVVSGSYEAINAFAKNLEQKNITCKLLRTSHAFHSAMMEPIIAPLQAVIEKTSISIPKIPILSTVTANWLKDEEAKSPAYWAHHARATVNFSDAIKAIEEAWHPVFLELGPGTSATILAKQQGAAVNSRVVAVLDTASKSEGEAVSIKKSVGKIWQLGVDINWDLQYAHQKRIVLHDLPTYAYNKKRFWIEPPASYNTDAVTNKEFITADNMFIPGNGVFNQPEENYAIMRKDTLINKIKEVVAAASGIDITDANPHSNFTELGLDSLLLTQIASSVKKEFKLPVTFRQLNEAYNSLDSLARFLDANLPAHAYQVSNPVQKPAAFSLQPIPGTVNMQAGATAVQANSALNLIAQQLNLLAQQVALMQGQVPLPAAVNTPQSASIPQPENAAKNEELTSEEKVEMKKPFGATARIETKAADITEEQKKYLADFIEKYNAKTKKSKDYTQQNRAHMADPRVVSGFKPLTKEMVYSIVVKQSKGCYLWDIDDNKYVDALNGFGSNFLGYQHEVLKKAILEQVEKGYEIGPQHELAAELTKLVCEFTGMDRAGLCNTGSEAVLGAMRIARTVTNKNTIVLFSGFYHGINDEVVVRGTKKLKTFPAASGILKDNVQNILILEYGADESLDIINEKANEIAAVLVEPVQSRRPEFRPVEFLKKLRTITEHKEVVLIFDEVITGFRSHPGGAQALFGVKADIAAYGKVVGGGISIGIIAGKKKYMDALDGGYWQYGDGSVPEVGVTYFAGTFVRHPLALATSLASLKFFKEQGPALQEAMNAKCEQLALRLNVICLKYKIPVFVTSFSSLWKIKFKEEYPYHEILFALMRYKNVHILDGFPCYLTLAHTQEDLDKIVNVFEESIAELCKIGFIPQTEIIAEGGIKMLDNQTPPLPGAQLGKDNNGNPAWFIQDVKNPGKYLQIDI